MFKNVLIITGLALTSATQAQTITNQVQLPGQRPGESPQAAARAGEVSQLQQVLAQNFVGGAWADVSRSTYLRYRTATLPGLVRSERKNGASWVPSVTHRLRYTSAGEIQSDSTDQYLQAPAGPYAALVGTFTSPGQVRQELQTMRDFTRPTAPWDSVTRTTHTYNAAGQRTQVLEELYFLDAFELAGRRLWTYNAQGQTTVFERQSAPASGTAWEPFQRQTYTYNATGHVQQIISELANIAGATYLNTSRNTMQFDAQGRESVLTTDNWENNAWKLYSRTLYDYSATGDLVSATAQLWDGSTFLNAQRLLLSYAQVLSARPAATTLRPLAVVPNPSSAADAPARLQLEPGAVPASGAVYDHLGRRVAELTCPPAQAARGSLPLPAGLPAGLYVVRLQAGSRQWQARWDKR